MEFWSVEVEGGNPLKVKLEGRKVRVSQASLGEVKKAKGNDPVSLFLNISGQKLVIGTLSRETHTQSSLSLFLTEDFELSHTWKNGSVFFCGYTVSQDSPVESTDSEEEVLNFLNGNGKQEPNNEPSSGHAGKSSVAKLDSFAAKSNLKTVKSKEDAKSKGEDDEDDDSEDDDSDNEDEENDSFDKLMSEDLDESSDGEDESSDDEKFTPMKAEPSKKRSKISPSKSEKRAKLVTPEKTGNDRKKNNVHVATPYPSKQASKAAANIDKSKQQTPKSAGQISCKSCSKTFGSEAAVEAHTKAKHRVPS